MPSLEWERFHFWDGKNAILGMENISFLGWEKCHPLDGEKTIPMTGKM